MSSHEDQREADQTPDSGHGAIPLAEGSETAARGARVLCPYCGLIQPVTARCAGCKGLLDPESRQATQNAMGPWYVRNPAAAHHPGCSYPTLRDLVRRGKVTRETILRGPTTGQFWNMAANTPGVAVLLGECHACHQPAREDEYVCRHCGVVLTPRTDRQHLGLAPVRTVGVPVSQPPVVSSIPVSALGVPAAPPAESAFAVPSAIPLPMPVSVPTIDGQASVFGTDAVLAKRRAGDRRRKTALLIGAAAFSLVAVFAVGVIVSRTKPAKPAASPSQPSAESSRPVPAPVPAAQRFAEDLKEAARLSASSAVADLESAVRMLEGVRKVAAAEPSPDKAFLANLDITIEKARVKLDDVRLNEALSGGATDSNTPQR